MISGMYLGEVARLALLDLTQEGIIFNGKFPSVFDKPHSLDTKYLSEA